MPSLPLASRFPFDLVRASVAVPWSQENFVADLLWAQPERGRTVLLTAGQGRWLVCVLDFSAPLFCTVGLHFLTLDAMNRLIKDYSFFK